MNFAYRLALHNLRRQQGYSLEARPVRPEFSNCPASSGEKQTGRSRRSRADRGKNVLLPLGVGACGRRSRSENDRQERLVRMGDQVSHGQPVGGWHLERRIRRGRCRYLFRAPVSQALQPDSRSDGRIQGSTEGSRLKDHKHGLSDLSLARGRSSAGTVRGSIPVTLSVERSCFSNEPTGPAICNNSMDELVTQFFENCP